MDLKLLKISLTHPLRALGVGVTLALGSLNTSLALIVLDLERHPAVGRATRSNEPIFLGLS